MKIKHSLALLLCGVLFAPPTMAEADPPGLTEVVASQNLSVRRNDGQKPVKEKNIHPKTIDRREKNKLDRFAMIRFDSEHFGKNVRAIALRLKARDTEHHKDNFRFRVYAVRDGDKLDEQFTEKDYDPSAEGTVFQNTSSMLDRKQVVLLGTFTTRKGKDVQFATNTLLSLARTDRNGTVTLIITRLTEGGENSTFEPRQSKTPPTLVIKLAEPKVPDPKPDPEPKPEPKPEEPEPEPMDPPKA